MGVCSRVASLWFGVSKLRSVRLCADLLRLSMCRFRLLYKGLYHLVRDL